MAFFDSLFFHLYFSLPLICATFGHFFFFPLHRKTAHAQAHKRGHTQARTAKEPLSLDAHTEGTGNGNEPRKKNADFTATHFRRSLRGHKHRHRPFRRSTRFAARWPRSGAVFPSKIAPLYATIRATSTRVSTTARQKLAILKNVFAPCLPAALLSLLSTSSARPVYLKRFAKRQRGVVVYHKYRGADTDAGAGVCVRGERA